MFPDGQLLLAGGQGSLAGGELLLSGGEGGFTAREGCGGGCGLLLRVLSTVGEAAARHLLADAALLQEGLLVVLDEVPKHHVGLADEGDGNVADHLIGAIGQDGIVVLAVVVFAATLARVAVTAVGGLPLLQVVVGEVVLVVLEQLLVAGFGDVEQFDFSLFAGGGGGSALDNVLFAAAGGLYHLVNSAVAVAVHEGFAEIVRHIADALRLLIDHQGLVLPVLGQEITIQLCHLVIIKCKR